MERVLARSLGTARRGSRAAAAAYAVGRAVFGPRRRFHAYGVGTSRSGTHSLVAAFSGAVRAAHEPLAWRTNQAEVRLRSGAFEPGARRLWLQRRDVGLWLELEASHALGAFVPDLVELFPEARFVLTIRDCFTWLQSEMSKAIGTTGASWNQLAAARYGGAEDGLPAEDLAPRRTLGPAVYPVSRYLRWWVEHNRRVLDSVPPERLLVVRTDRVRSSGPDLARFLGIPENLYDGDAAHVRARAPTGYVRLLDHVSAAFLDEAAGELCGDLLRTYFPEITSAGDRLAS